MRKLLLLAAVFISNMYADAQITFQKTYGRTGGDAAYDILLTADGGYIIAGFTGTSGGSMQDACLIKTDSNGDTLWTKSYGGTSNEYFRAVASTSDGGYIATGSTNSFGSSNNNLYLVKTDSAGNLLWSKTYNGPSEEIGNAVKQTADGGYIIAGEAGLLDLYLIKTNSTGDTLWTRVLNGAMGASVFQTNDGGYIVGGKIISAGPEATDFYMVKTNSSGDTLWTKIYGSTGTESGQEMQPTSDGGYIMAGSTTSFGSGGTDVYLVKTDSIGQLLWSKAYGGTAADIAASVQQTSDGGYILGGNSMSFGAGLNDLYMIKTDNSGTLEWSKAYGGSGGELGYRVRQANDGGYILAGLTTTFGSGGQQEMYIVKTDSAGNSNCNESTAATLTAAPATLQSVFSKAIQPGGAVGNPATTVSDGVTITTLCTTVGIQSVTVDPQFAISVFPNPSPGNFEITFGNIINNGVIEIYNLLGERLNRENIFNESKKEINLKNIPGGVYFLKVFNGENNYCRKLIVVRD